MTSRRTPCGRWLRAFVNAVLVSAAGLLLPIPAAAQAAPATGTLTVVALDPSGAAIPGAVVAVALESTPADEPREHIASPTGSVTMMLAPASYLVTVSAPGFTTVQLPRVRVSPSATVRREVRLPIEPITASVDVRDARNAALDPRGFSTFLSRAQIDALPDDPEGFARALQELAPPGAVIRVDGFTGGMLPPKSQILSIRIPRFDSFSAQEHGGLSGISFIDIVTRPGAGVLQGSVDATGASSAVNARNPLARGREPASGHAVTVAFDGPLVRSRLSFALAVRGGMMQETATILAAVPGGLLVHDSAPQPREQLTASGRLVLALRGDHTARVSFSSERSRTANAGVGGSTLRERGYMFHTGATVVRLSTGGPIGRHAHVETRVQLQRSASRSTSNVEEVAVQVLDAFSAGGAQVTGGGRSTQLLASSDVDRARGVHALRAGVLVETAGYEVNRRSNYLGTYTFSSLEHYVNGQAALYTRRLGDGRMAYRDTQLGGYVQDDIRIARSTLLSLGLRYERQALTRDRGLALPRAAVAWSPSRSGGTTVRAAWGRFGDWIGTNVYEPTLLIDGTRQHDIRVMAPSYPVAAEAGAPLPRERYVLAEDLRLPRGYGLSLGIEQLLPAALRLHGSYTRRTGTDLLSGDDRNRAQGGSRPDPAFGAVIAAANLGSSRTHTITMQLATTRRVSRIDGAGLYVFSTGGTNSTGAFALPASGDLAAEWGPSAPAHVASATVNVRPLSRLVLSVHQRWRSGTPYSITTGRDDNGDGFLADRPFDTGRNGARTPPYWDVGARVAYVWSFGTPRDPSSLVPSAGGDAPSLRAGSVARGDAGGETQRFRVELFASAQNALNRPQVIAVGSVTGSPFFGQPTAATAPRHLDFGLRFAF